jgi:hypothetical protein
MKTKSLFAAATVFLIPALAFAGQKNSANVSLDQPVKVAGTQLAPGQYKVMWEGNGPDVTVSFLERLKRSLNLTIRRCCRPSTQRTYPLNWKTPFPARETETEGASAILWPQHFRID